MKNLVSKLTRSAVANTLAVAGAGSLVGAAFTWCAVAGYAALGVALLAAGWAVDE
jgi:hypothetical protein